MATDYGNKSIITDGLIFATDAANKQSWTGPNSSTVHNFMGTHTCTIYNDTSGSYGVNNSFEFDGTDSYMDTGVTPNTLVGSSNAYTVSVWVYPQGNGAWNMYEQEIIGAANYWSSAQRFSFFLKSANSYASDISPCYRYGSSTNGNIYTTTSSPTVPKNQWSHVAFTFDGNTTHKIYVNGEEIVEQTNGSTQTISSTRDLYIGVRNENGNKVNYFNGDMGPLHVYNSGLSASEVLQNYNALKGRFE